MREKVKSTLKKSERVFKTDMSYLVKGSFWFTMRHGIGTVLGLASAVVLAAYLSKDAYGIYKYVLALASIAGAFSFSSGMMVGVTNAIAKSKFGTLRAAFWDQLKWSAGTMLVAFGMGAYYLWNENVTFALSFFVVGFTTPLINSAALYVAFFQGRQLFQVSAITESVRAIIQTGIVITCVYFFESPLVVVAAHFGGGALAALIMYWYTTTNYETRGEVAHDQIKFSRHLGAIDILTAFSEQIDKILIFQYLGPVQLAIYSFAIAIPLQIKGLLKNLYWLLVPKFALRSYQEISSGMLNKNILFFLFILVLALGYVIAAPLIFTLLFPTYMDAVIYSQVFVLYAFGSLGLLPSAALTAKTSKNALYVSSIVAAFLRIGFLWGGIAFYGLWGAIVGAILGKIAGVIALFIAFSITARRQPTDTHN